MTATQYRGWFALLAGALFGGCVMEPGEEPGESSELAGAASLTPVDPCNSPFTPNPDFGVALPLAMSKTGTSSRLPVDSDWYTNVLIQNTSSSLATVRLRAISAAGTPYCNIFSLGAEAAVNFRTDNTGAAGTIGIPNFPSGNFEGSMVIESDQRLAAVAKLTNVPLETMGRTGGTAAAAYQGLSMRYGSADTGQELANSAMKSGFHGRSSTLFVQNVEPWGDYLYVRVVTNDAKVYTYSAYVSGYRSVAINPGDLRDASGVAMPASCPAGGANPGQAGAPCFGSVHIVPTSEYSARFGAITVEHPASGPASSILASQFENIWTAQHRQWHPVVKNQYQGATSGISVMNVTGAFQDVTVILRKKAAPWIEYRYTFEDVPPYRSVVASPYNGTFGGFLAGEIGTAEIQSTGAIASATSETSSNGSESSTQGQSVAGDLAAPLIQVAWFGRKTRTTLWNVGSQPVQIVGRYKCHTSTSSTYSNHTHSMTAGPGVAVEFEPINIPAGNLCSAIFTTSQRTLVGVVSEESMTEPAAIDGSIYEAILLD